MERKNVPALAFAMLALAAVSSVCVLGVKAIDAWRRRFRSPEPEPEPERPDLVLGSDGRWWVIVGETPNGFNAYPLETGEPN